MAAASALGSMQAQHANLELEGALEALAQREDPSLVPQIGVALDDAKDDVRFSAAACVAHLSEIPTEKTVAEPTKP